MIEQLRIWVINIVTLTTIIVLLEILVPKGKTKKFVNLASGFILIIAIINPMVGIVKKGFDFKEIQTSSSNLIDAKDIEYSGKILKDTQMKQIVEAYRSKLVKQLEDTTKEIKGIEQVNADVIFNEDYKSEHFGEIKRVILNLKTEDKTTDIKPVVKVENIELNSKDKPKPESKPLDKELLTQIENKISKMLEIKKEDIVINTQAQ